MKMTTEIKDRLINIEKKLQEWDFPPQIVIETTSVCNQKCIHCNHKIMKRAKQHMDIDIFKKIIDDIAQTAPNTEVWPTFYGEATTLGDKLYEILKYARDKGLTNMVLNSNGVLLDRYNWIDKILTSGLKRLIFSIDGFAPEVFNKVRAGGNRDKIYKSIEKLLKRKEELKLEFPVIQCQFSIMDANKHEVEIFKKYWEERGAEVKTRNMLSWTNSGDVIANNLDYNTSFRIACPWANNTLAIHQNGNVVTCAVDYEGKCVIGNVKDYTLKELWDKHNKIVRKPHKEHRWKDIPEICKNCPDWQVAGAKYHKNDKLGFKKEARPFWWKDENYKLKK